MKTISQAPQIRQTLSAILEGLRYGRPISVQHDTTRNTWLALSAGRLALFLAPDRMRLGECPDGLPGLIFTASKIAPDDYVGLAGRHLPEHPKPVFHSCLSCGGTGAMLPSAINGQSMAGRNPVRCGRCAGFGQMAVPHPIEVAGYNRVVDWHALSMLHRLHAAVAWAEPLRRDLKGLYFRVNAIVDGIKGLRGFVSPMPFND